MDLKEKVFDILRNLVSTETIAENDNLKEDLLMDSLAMVLLLVQIEEMFKIQLDESDMNPFDLVTVADVIKLTREYCEVQNEEES